jgi:peptidyl-tRNA hydrolase
LQDFSNADQLIISEALNRAMEAVLMWVTDGLDAAMNKYNGAVREP